MHKRSDGLHQISLTTRDESLVEQIEARAEEADMSENKLIWYYVRQGLQREMTNNPQGIATRLRVLSGRIDDEASLISKLEGGNNE